MSRITEGAPYDHDEYGRVKVVVIQDDIVRARTEDDRLIIEPIDQFERLTDPAPQTITADPATVFDETPQPGG